MSITQQKREQKAGQLKKYGEIVFKIIINFIDLYRPKLVLDSEC